MAASAFERLKQAAAAVVSTGESLVRTSTPLVSRAAGAAVARLRGSESVAVPQPPDPSASPSPPVPTPALIAKNVAKQRPVAVEPQRRATPTPDDTPGAKLPPPRRAQPVLPRPAE